MTLTLNEEQKKVLLKVIGDINTIKFQEILNELQPEEIPFLADLLIIMRK